MDFCELLWQDLTPGPPFFHGKFLPNSTVQFVKFYEIPQHYYPQVPNIPWPVGIVMLTENTSKYKEFIVTCNTKTHYIRPLMMKILGLQINRVNATINAIKD